jgi:hypothetical protein
MARSSYFQAIAPAARTTPIMRLAPAPPLFRPAAAPAAFLAIDSWNEPPRQTIDGYRPATGARGARPDGTGVALPDRPDSPVSEKHDSGDTTRPAPSVDTVLAPAPRTARPAAAAILPRPTIETEPARPTMRTRGAYAHQPTREPERPRRSLPTRAPTPTAPLVMLQPPAPRPSAQPSRSSPASGVHIGTLEVRVVAPAPPPKAAPPPAVWPRFAARAPATRQARSGARLSRSFAVFGLGQS